MVRVLSFPVVSGPTAVGPARAGRAGTPSTCRGGTAPPGSLLAARHRHARPSSPSWSSASRRVSVWWRPATGIRRPAASCGHSAAPVPGLPRPCCHSNIRERPNLLLDCATGNAGRVAGGSDPDPMATPHSRREVRVASRQWLGGPELLSDPADTFVDQSNKDNISCDRRSTIELSGVLDISPDQLAGRWTPSAVRSVPWDGTAAGPKRPVVTRRPQPAPVDPAVTGRPSRHP